jgi:N-acetylglucosamine-6-sulfatase
MYILRPLPVRSLLQPPTLGTPLNLRTMTVNLSVSEQMNDQTDIQSFARLRSLGPAIAVGLLAVIAIALGTGADRVKAAVRPSFVVIQLDDFTNTHLNSRWIDSEGRKRPNMPITRELLVDRGMTFTRYQTSTPVCSPSRASLLSGRYAANHDVLRNIGERGGWQAFSSNPILSENLATWLDSSGYRTMHFGKFLNQYELPGYTPNPLVPPGWDVWQTDATDPSTRNYYGYRLNVNGLIEGPFGSIVYGPDTEKETEDCLVLGPRFCQYHTDLVTTRAIEAIEQTDSSEPFYAQIDFHTPHGDRRAPYGPEPALRHYDSAKATPIPRVWGYDEANVSDKPSHIRKLKRIDPASAARIRSFYSKAVESLQAVDESIETVIQTLARTGRLKNTYVILTSDNGLFHGEHRVRTGKVLPYEAAVTVPFLIRGPGVPQGEESGELVAAPDIAPTVLSLAGTSAPVSLDGRSMVPFLKDPEKKTRRPILYALYGRNGSGATEGTRPFYEGIRVGPYKYVRYATGERELYDLTRDPAELVNQIKNPRFRSVLAYMESTFSRYLGCEGTECRRPAPQWPVVTGGSTKPLTGSAGGVRPPRDS